ncbi:efflux transporter outer membrane subunit [Roseateles sp. DAIF2]|uniref:efflux transporter outer membrane subunit n=1 Tax=Roseateles sp. DAIF2 TaxID=2714952 RepID=UPI0018A2A443|nr:efflux transporter outer membrane subunit [Roseateles sp. DAIF2]QPF75607.1 efflux transporter outer membrane subunit [Roseateles sp. DAIF2]
MHKKKLTLVGAAAAALLLSGCMSLAPQHERPAAPVAADWPAPATAGAQKAAELSWQDFYAGDARLRELIALALQNNRDLRVALLNVEKARAQYRITDASRLPTVGVGFSSQRSPAASGNGSISGVYQAGLQVTAYELDLFGKLKNNSDAAMAAYLATAEGQRAARLSLVAGVAGAQLNLQAAEELLALAQQTRATREDSLKLMRMKFDAGAASQLDLSSAESAAGAARASLAAAQRSRDEAENALVLLVGQPLPRGLPAAQPLQALNLPEVPAGLPSEVLVTRPDVLQAEQQLIAANANIGAARAAFFPSITLTASAGTASTQLSDLFQHTAWSFASQILMPIFDSGRTRANVEVAKANQGIAVAQYEKAVQTAFREVADALAGHATLDEQLAAQTQQADAEAKRLELVELRFKNGASSTLELLDAQRSSYAAQQALLQVQLAKVLNRVQLYKVLGGGAEPKAAT